MTFCFTSLPGSTEVALPGSKEVAVQCKHVENHDKIDFLLTSDGGLLKFEEFISNKAYYKT